MRAALMVFVIVSAPLSGCLSGEGGSLSEEDLYVGPDELVSGHFQSVSLESGHDMSVYVPYLVRDPITGFIQNSTVIDIERGGSFSLDLLSPPRVSMLVMLVGEYGRTNWPVREENQSWGSWLENGGILVIGGPRLLGCTEMAHWTLSTVAKIAGALSS